MCFGHRASDRCVARLVRAYQSQRTQPAEQANVENDKNERNAPKGNLDVGFFNGVRADWGSRIQFAESSIALESFQQQGAKPLIPLPDGLHASHEALRVLGSG